MRACCRLWRVIGLYCPVYQPDSIFTRCQLGKKNECRDELEGGFQPEGDFVGPTFLGCLRSVCIKSSKLAEKLVYREIVQIHCDGSVKEYNYTDTSFSARVGHCHLDYLDSVPSILSPLALPRAGVLNHLIVDH